MWLSSPVSFQVRYSLIKGHRNSYSLFYERNLSEKLCTIPQWIFSVPEYRTPGKSGEEMDEHKFYLKWPCLTWLCLLKPGLEYMESLACSLAFQISTAPWSMSNDEGYKEPYPCPSPFILRLWCLHLLTLCFLLIFSLLMLQKREDLLSGFLRKKDLHIG